MNQNDDEKNSEFINDTIKKLKEQLTKFLVNTNYSNIQSLYLRQQIDNYEKQLSKSIDSKKVFPLINKNLNNETILPILINKNNPNNYYDRSEIFKTKTYPHTIKRLEHLKNKSLDNSEILPKGSVKFDIKRLKNKEYMKFCNEYRNQRYFRPKIYDKNNNYIITKKDIDKGFYDMINKGFIPFSADISPAMALGGNPISITKQVNFKNLDKAKGIEEVATGRLNKFTFKQNSINEVYRSDKKLKPISKDWGIKDIRSVPYYHETINEKQEKFKKNVCTSTNENNNVFITSTEEQKIIKESVGTSPNNVSEFDNNKNYSTIKGNNNSCNSAYYNNSSTTCKSKNKSDDDIIKTFYKFVKNLDMTNNLILKFEHYQIIKDENYETFKKNNNKLWYEIENILNNFSILFEKLNILKTEIDTNKILELLKFYNNQIQNITNKDLLMCLTDQEIKEKKFDPEDEKLLYQEIKKAFIIRIQKMIRKKLAYNHCQFLRVMNISMIIIQKNYRRYIIQKKIKSLLENEREMIHNKFIEIFNDFKLQWETNQENSKIEIHINSISTDSYTNCLTDKYSLKECLQLNRLIKLNNPNIEIIYIIPHPIPDEILSYYFSVLESIGITNIENRLHFIIPDATEFCPPNYSLTKLLYLSQKTINQIKELTKNKFSYIIPGITSPLEENISYLLNIPIFMGNKEQIDLIFNKSGIKSAFELNDVPFPISAWDIKTEEEFYSSLAHLIITYPNIEVWILKCNTELNAKGIAYLNISKIDFINQLRFEKKNNTSFTDEIFQEKLYYQLKKILTNNIQYAYKNLYSNWNEYLTKFLNGKGIIECCPTKDLDGVMGNPCIPMFIEPNGKIKLLPAFEKINVDFFKNVVCTSPQNCIDNSELIKLGEKIGNFLYSQEIIGYITIECITFHDGKKILYWGIDMKYGLTQQICDLQYCYFLYIQSTNLNKERNLNNFGFIKEEFDDQSEKNSSNSSCFNENCIIDYKNYNHILPDILAFSFPYFSTDLVKEIKLKDFLREFRFSNIIFDIEKKEGIIFNLCDGLECGFFGLCGVCNLDSLERIYPSLKLWKLIDKTIGILKDFIFKSQKKNILSNMGKNDSTDRNDKVDIQLIFKKVKDILKEKEIEQKKEENRRKIIANTPYL